MTEVSLELLIKAAISGTAMISFPTDTVPALATRSDMAHLIFAAKQRQPDKPLILMAADAADLWPYVTGTPDELQHWQETAQKGWPGALTLVLPASERVPGAMNPTDPTTIGVRVPDHNLACQILRATGPLATTSANLSGFPPLETLPEITTQFPTVLTPDASYWQTGSGLPSTVALWQQSRWQILRQGAVELKFEG